jgi:hypothetical protein
MDGDASQVASPLTANHNRLLVSSTTSKHNRRGYHSFTTSHTPVSLRWRAQLLPEIYATSCAASFAQGNISVRPCTCPWAVS